MLSKGSESSESYTSRLRMVVVNINLKLKIYNMYKEN